ncbi:hypothetical protein AAHH67_16160 [Niallia circulans]
MKATIDNLLVEGTPQEIHEFYRLFKGEKRNAAEQMVVMQKELALERSDINEVMKHIKQVTIKNPSTVDYPHNTWI